MAHHRCGPGGRCAALTVTVLHSGKLTLNVVCVCVCVCVCLCVLAVLSRVGGRRRQDGGGCACEHAAAQGRGGQKGYGDLRIQDENWMELPISSTAMGAA